MPRAVEKKKKKEELTKQLNSSKYESIDNGDIKQTPWSNYHVSWLYIPP